MRSIRDRLRDDGSSKAVLAIALALLTVLATVVAGLEGQASIATARAQREADRLAIELSGAEGTSLLSVGAGYGTYRRWYEEMNRSDWAYLLDIADETDDTNERHRLLQALATIEADLQAWTTGKTDLLQGPYFDADTEVADFAAYEAERIVAPLARLAERRDAEAAVAGAWNDHAADFLTILTITAVGLFFLGLGATVGGRARPFLAGAGMLFGVVAGVWTVSVVLRPVERIGDEAIEQVVSGMTAVARVDATASASHVDPAVRTALLDAVAFADAALAAEPGYAAARRLRADTRSSLADDLSLSADGPSDETRALLAQAVDDYHVLTAADPDDYGLWWNLGWAQLLAGDPAASVAATDRALALQPASASLRINRAIARTLAGEADASDDVDRAIETIVAAGGGRGMSSAEQLGDDDWNLHRLATLYPDRAEALLGMRDHLREARVALRLSGGASAEPAADAPLLPLVGIRLIDLGLYARGVFSEGPVLDEGVTVTQPQGVGLRVDVPASPDLAGHMLSARLWVDGRSDPAFARDVRLDGTARQLDLVSPYGLAEYDLEPGAYELELYVDGDQQLRRSFTVAPRIEVPTIEPSASELIATVDTAGFDCAAPVPTQRAAPGRTDVACSGFFGGDGNYLGMTVTADDRDHITFLYLEATTYDGVDVVPVARDHFDAMIDLVFPADMAAEASAWLREQGTTVNEIEIGGATFRTIDAEPDRRFLDIWADWPSP